jgi:beta-lactamase regulating signal transducer with metallopeptidase domain
MNELLHALLRQAVLLSVAALVLLALRPLLLRHLGARAAYAAWLLVPAMLLTPWLPRLAPGAAQITAIFSDVAPLALPAPAPSTGAWPWLLTAWLSGTAAVLLWQGLRQWGLAWLGAGLPAGASPALVGLLRPRVALPVDFGTRFSAEEQQLILAHEAVHRSRGDNAWNLLACALTALHWWNPLAWLAARRMQADQELACDATVLAAHPGSQPAYTRALLAAHGLTPPQAPLASRWGSTHPLVERIAMLNRTTPLTRRRALLLGLSMAGVVGMSYAMQATPPTAPGSAYIRLALSLVFQEGDTVRRSSVSLVGKDGETMKVVVGAQAATATEPGFSVELTPVALDEEKFQLDIAFNGLPPALRNGPQRVIARYGDAATLESVDAKTSARSSVFLVGTRVAAPTGATAPVR